MMFGTSLQSILNLIHFKTAGIPKKTTGYPHPETQPVRLQVVTAEQHLPQAPSKPVNYVNGIGSTRERSSQNTKNNMV